MSVSTSAITCFSMLGLFGLTVACGANEPAVKSPSGLTAYDDSQDQMAAPPMENVQAPLTQLERADVDQTIADGVPRFLQGFTIVEELDENDRFIGWKVAKVHDRKKFEGLGIGTGDVIKSINGLPLERPADAYQVMIGLKQATSLDVEYLRGGRVMRLSLPIVGQSSPPAATPNQAPKMEEPKAAPQSGAKSDAKEKK